MANAKPLPSPPSRLAAGTRHSAKSTSACDEPRPADISMPRPTVRPGVPASTTKAEMPLWPSAGSTVAKTVNSPASIALVM